MVTIYNKSNRPVGVANQSVLPDGELKIQDKHAYCAVFDENGLDTGKKQLLPGLVALANFGIITITEEKEEQVEEKPKAKRTRKPKEETKEEPTEE